MDLSLLRILILGLILGLEHSLDPDHLVAVSTLQARGRSRTGVIFVGALWGLGHAATILLAGMLVILFKISIPISAFAPLESIVGIMLVALGARVLWRYRREKVHVHVHGHDGGEPDHIHFHSHAATAEHGHDHSPNRYEPVLVGMVHGLAGSAALTLLLVGSISSQFLRLMYVLAFGVGSIVGMVAVSVLIGYFLEVASRRSFRIQGPVRLVVGISSILFGVILIGGVILP